jgi:predicted DNA-binding transcriptional regulator AlpA
MDNSQPIFKRPKQAARHFGIGPSTYWHWVKTRPGFPQPVKAGPAVTLVDIPATEAYLRAHSAEELASAPDPAAKLLSLINCVGALADANLIGDEDATTLREMIERRGAA